jgi:ankyrin repeat protein
LNAANLSRVCLTFLSTEDNNRFAKSENPWENNHYYHPLLHYCSLGWAKHATSRDDDPSFIKSSVALLEDEGNVEFIAHVLQEEGICYGGKIYDNMPPIHICACLGLQNLLLYLLPGQKALKRLDWIGRRLPKWVWNSSLINSTDFWGRTPLILAIQTGHSAVALSLIEQPNINVNILTANRTGRSALSYAAEARDVAVSKALLRKGAKHRWPSGLRSPLSYAAAKDAADVVRLLLDIPNIQPDVPDSEEHRMPLSYAASEGAIEAARLLLNSGKVDVNSRGCWGRTPLSYAVSAGAINMVRLLLENGKTMPDAADNSGRTPLSFAAEKGRMAVMKLLLESGVDADARDHSGRTPLSYAASSMVTTSTFKLLLESGKVDCDSQDNRQRTPLWYASRSGATSIVELLLQTGKVNVNARDKKGRTPLSVAAEELNCDLVRLLIKANARVNLKDVVGRTPLFVAQAQSRVVTELRGTHRRRKSMCIALLTEAGGRSMPRRASSATQRI